jgi:hypothetical protein
VSALPDGVHEVFIIDATGVALGDGTTAGTAGGGATGGPTGYGQVWVLDLTVVSGPHKGEVVSVRASNLDGDEFDLMGMPATLTVTNGNPVVRIDR